MRHKICNGKDVTAGSAKISKFEEHTGVDSRNVLGDSISRTRSASFPASAVRKLVLLKFFAGWLKKTRAAMPPSAEDVCYGAGNRVIENLPTVTGVAMPFVVSDIETFDQVTL
ncbi:MAG: hypothetical protein JWQ49_5435 [Edaphobacter sp.]|nr:hypothetical protein [Edaphobacter sp.]